MPKLGLVLLNNYSCSEFYGKIDICLEEAWLPCNSNGIPVCVLQVLPVSTAAEGYPAGSTSLFVRHISAAGVLCPPVRVG